MFEHIQPYAGDPIFALVDAFHADPRPQKVNLSIGIYFDEQGRLPVLPSEQQAEARILAAGGAKPYLPMEGDAACRAEVAKLLQQIETHYTQNVYRDRKERLLSRKGAHGERDGGGGARQGGEGRAFAERERER